jgi:Fe-S-cluster containining protein
MSYESRQARDWFEDLDPKSGKPGLRFQCTMCGNCCTGPEGYIHVSDEEAAALARRLNISTDEFLHEYTRQTVFGRSLIERPTPHGLDCIFLDRTSIPGKAVCGVYEDRPAQCRTWPFWPSIIASRRNWEHTKRTCPGIDKGPLIPPEQIRIQRDRTPRDPSR